MGTFDEVQLLEYALGHLRACGPCGIGNVRAWLIEQVPGVEINNADEAVSWFVNTAIERKIVEIEYNQGTTYLGVKDV